MSKVAIIGGGPAGAIAIQTFVDAGFDVTLYERHCTLGGTWTLDEQLNFSPEEDVPGFAEGIEDSSVKVPEDAENASRHQILISPKHLKRSVFDQGSLYPQVEANVIAELLQFPKKPFRPLNAEETEVSVRKFGEDDTYRGHEDLRRYVLEYFEGHESRILLNTSVERVWQPDGPGSRWKLSVRRCKRDGKAESGDDEGTEWWTDEADFVYAASGRFNVPFVPEIPGLREAISKAPRGTILHTKTFRDPSIYKNKRVLIVGAGYSSVDGAHLSHEAGAAEVHLSFRRVLDFVIPWIAQPWIKTHTGIDHISIGANNALKVTFSDGSNIEVDSIILATGYLYSYPYLKEYLSKYDGITMPGGRGTKNLLWSTWWKHDASLTFSSHIGCAFFWKSLAMRAEASAALWKLDRKEWPSVEETEKWEAHRRANLPGHDFNWWYPDYASLFCGLAATAHLPEPYGGQFSEFEGVLARSVGLKGSYLARLAQEYLARHPESQHQYEETLSALQSRSIKTID